MSLFPRAVFSIQAVIGSFCCILQIRWSVKTLKFYWSLTKLLRHCSKLLMCSVSCILERLRCLPGCHGHWSLNKWIFLLSLLAGNLLRDPFFVISYGQELLVLNLLCRNLPRQYTLAWYFITIFRPRSRRKLHDHLRGLTPAENRFKRFLSMKKWQDS